MSDRDKAAEYERAAAWLRERGWSAGHVWRHPQTGEERENWTHPEVGGRNEFRSFLTALVSEAPREHRRRQFAAQAEAEKRVLQARDRTCPSCGATPGVWCDISRSSVHSQRMGK